MTEAQLLEAADWIRARDRIEYLINLMEKDNPLY
jgi:hypothetical protein